MVVLDRGCLAEMDSPGELLSRPSVSQELQRKGYGYFLSFCFIALKMSKSTSCKRCSMYV